MLLFLLPVGKAGASVIALDFAFVGSSPLERGGRASDELLAQAIKDTGHVVLPLPVQIGNVSPAVQVGREQPHLDHFMNTLGSSIKAENISRLEKASLIGAVLPDLFESTHRWGHIASASDDDGVFRRVPVLLQVEGHAVPAFGVAIAASYLNLSSEDISIQPGHHITLHNEQGANGKTSDLEIPIDAQNQLLVNYAGVWNSAPFTYLLFSDVLETITEDKLHELKHWVDGKIVLIFHAGAEHDTRRTPLELRAPGGFIHASVIHTILTRAFLSNVSEWTTLLILLVVTMATAACVVYRSRQSGWLGVLMIMGSYLILSQLALSVSGRIYPLVLPFIGMVGSTGLASAWVLWVKRQQLESLEATLEQSQHELIRAREDLTQTESIVEQLEEDLAASKTEALSAETHQRQGSREIQEWEEKIQIAAAQLHTSRNDVIRLEDDLKSSRAQSLSAENQHPQSQSLQKLEGTLQEAESRLHTAQSEVARLEERLADNRKTVALAEKNQEHAFQNTRKVEAKLHAAETKLHASQKEITQLKKSLPKTQPTAIRPVMLSDHELEQLRQECETRHNILTNDDIVLSQYKDLKKVAKTHMSILILGEPGTGKELFARAVHDLSARSGDFVPTNMAAIPQHMFEAQWFGYAKGAFTDAKQDHKGFFNQAYDGTIFLDEIGDLELDMQAKLLRALETKVITPLGSTQSKTIDVRVVAATNKNLLKGVEDGWFRRDLYDRLLGFTLVLPPLRERQNDLELLARQIVQRASQELGRNHVQLTNDALASIKNWSWPGNIRELEKSLALTVALTDGNLIRVQDLRFDPHAHSPSQPIEEDQEIIQDVSGDRALLHCLRQNGFDMKATAKAVGWERSTVTQRLKGLCFQALIDNELNRTKAAQALARNEQIATRLVELKLNTYYDHLLKLVADAKTLEEAITTCRQRYKNLPDRHIPAMETLVTSAWEKNLTGLDTYP